MLMKGSHSPFLIDILHLWEQGDLLFFRVVVCYPAGNRFGAFLQKEIRRVWKDRRKSKL